MQEQELELTEVLTQEVEHYAAALTRKGAPAATVTRSIASIKSFYSCLVTLGIMDHNPAKGVVPAKVERKLPQILTGKEVELLLEQPECTDLKGYRDRAMLELLYATGIRVSELIALDVDDLNLSAGMLRCASKGRSASSPVSNGGAGPERIPAPGASPAGGVPSETAPLCQHERRPHEPSGLLEAHQSTIRRRRGSRRTSRPIPSATPFAAHLLENGADLRPFRRCWAMRTSPLHRSIPDC